MNAQINQTSKTITLPDVLLSYAYLAQPYVSKDSNNKDKASFCAHGVFSREHAATKIITDAINDIAKNAWGTDIVDQAVLQGDGSTIIQKMPKFQAMLVQFKQENKLPLRDGNRRQPLADPYKGNLFLSANNERRPRIVVTRSGVNVEIGTDDPQFPYSGCRANIVVDLWCQNTPQKPSKWGSRINAQLTGVQFLAHGNRLGGGGRTANLDEFGICNPADADAPPPGESPLMGVPSLV